MPKGCQLELITTRENTQYECILEKTKRQKIDSLDLDFSQIQMRSPAARGFRFTNRKILKFRFKGQIEEADLPPDEPNNDTSIPMPDTENESNDTPEFADVIPTDEKQSSLGVSPEKNEKEEPIPDKKQQKKEPENKKLKTRKGGQSKKAAKPLTKNDKHSTDDPVRALDGRAPARPLPKDDLTKKEKATEPPEKKSAKKEKVISEAKEGSDNPDNDKNEKPPSSDTKKDNEQDDDWGIVQPDLGF